MRARLPFAATVLLAASLPSARAYAQDKGDDQSTQSVPRGAGDAVIQKPSAPSPPAGQPTMPRPLNYAPPNYPDEARTAGIEGEVILELDIDKDGNVTSARVHQGAGHGFDEMALAAAKKLKFAPARMPDGTPFAARILYRYSFTLKPAEAPKPAQQTPSQPQGASLQAPATASIHGTVTLSSDDTPIAGAAVTLRSEAPPGAPPETLFTRSATSDVKGNFDLRDLPLGSYTLTITAPGFQTLMVPEVFKAAASLEIRYRLAPKGTAQEITVRGERPPREVTKQVLEQREISRIPGTNGDALKSIQSLPGVARPPSIAGLLIVRGSAPQDTQTFIDGTPVPLIYHFGGLSSVVPTEMLDKIDFYPGNFSAQFGRAMGGIVDAGLRRPKDDGNYHGLLQFDLIDGRALLEGPIPFLDGWTFAAAGRRSYVDAWLGPTLKAAGSGVTSAPVYYDYQFVVNKNVTRTSHLRLAFFGSDDALAFLLQSPSASEPALAGSGGFHTAFERLQLKYDNELGDDRITCLLALGRDVVDIGIGSLFLRLSPDTLTGRLEYSHKMSKHVTFDAGFDLLSGYYKVDLNLPAPPPPGQPSDGPFSTRPPVEDSEGGGFFFPAAYVEAEITPTARLRIVPGVRVDYDGVTKRADLDPRVNARYDIVHEYPKTTLKGGVGVFTEPPQFQELAPPFGNTNLYANRSVHYDVGVEQQINRHVDLSLEGFYKQLDDLVVGTQASNGSSTNYQNVGTGKVIGSELLLKYKPDDRFFGWIAYTLSRSTRVDGPGQAEHLFNYDQTHILTILGSVVLGHGWEFGARFRLVSGNLVTPDVCDPSSGTCDPDRINALFHAPSGTYVSIPFGSTYSERLPMFHELDLRVDKRWRFAKWQLSAYLDVQNAYNYGNVEGIEYNYNYTARSYIAGLPILPSIGLRGEL